MNPEITWLDDPRVFRVNQVKAHSDHRCHENRDEADSEESSRYLSLNGEWQFCFSENADSRPNDFYQERFCADSFGTIQVPGHIELAGYDQLHYINTMYPWEGHEYRRAPFVLGEEQDGSGMFSKATYNPVGSYLKKFTLPEAMKGKQVSVSFEGVEQAFYVWLNGQFVGYAEDSFTPSEFDLTPYLKEENILAVEVHKRSTAAFLEDQDFFRFFGIFRSVKLIASGDNHLVDLHIKPVLEEDNTRGKLTLNMCFAKVTRGAQVLAKVLNPLGEEIILKKLALAEKISFKESELTDVLPWDYHHPNLYTLELEMQDENGSTTEFVRYKFGFRRVEIKDNVLLLNGKRLLINGVNRHEWSAKTGRAITNKEIEEDIKICLRNNINAIRTSHYPASLPFYDMCDESGLYVMAETNLESHGSWQKLGAVEPSVNVPGAVPQWLEVVLDRAKTNFETFKNHTSLLFWSLGNESYAEENIHQMYCYFKEIDPSRVVHYESDFHNPTLAKPVSDVKSRMYATPEEIVEYLENAPDKPFILCEYMHDMGNSLGGMKSYMDLYDQYEMYNGGFIWDYIDQALYVNDEVTGKPVLRYGGDFDDRPSDYEFSGNGIVFADRSEKPAMQEVKYYYGKYNQ